MTAGQIVGRDIPPDPATAPCAACGAGAGLVSGLGFAGQRRSYGGSLLMLCLDASACAQRYRRGLTPEAFAMTLAIQNEAWDAALDRLLKGGFRSIPGQHRRSS